jgi:iron(III) transport system substrate-binding protein
MKRRELLRGGMGLGLGLLGLSLAACAPQTPAPAPTSAAPAQSGQTEWDQLVAAAQKEGKVVVSGPPAPDASTKLPAAFKERFNIELEYLGGNSSQLAARIQAERAAGQYTIDVSLGGPDTVYGTFLPNKWLDPLKPVLILPDVVDPKVWPTGAPWFRDPGGDTSLQLFNTVAPVGYLNTSLVSPDELKTIDDLLNPKWQGKIASYDPSVNGGGLAVASAFYVTKGRDWSARLYQGQKVAFSRDYSQVADWVAHGSYPIVIAITHQYLIQYYQAGLPLNELNFPDVPPTTTGNFGLINLWNNAPHPNAAKALADLFLSEKYLQASGDLGYPVTMPGIKSAIPEANGLTYADLPMLEGDKFNDAQSYFKGIFKK